MDEDYCRGISDAKGETINLLLNHLIREVELRFDKERLLRQMKYQAEIDELTKGDKA